MLHSLKQRYVSLYTISTITSIQGVNFPTLKENNEARSHLKINYRIIELIYILYMFMLNKCISKSLLTPLHVLQGPPVPEEKAALIPDLIEPWFLFSLVWAIPACCDADGRNNFSSFLREKMKQAKVSFHFFLIVC